jgi:hypothetical protein
LRYSDQYKGERLQQFFIELSKDKIRCEVGNERLAEEFVEEGGGNALGLRF